MKEINSKQWIIADLDTVLSWIDTFILEMLRNGVDVFSFQLLMDHADIL